MTKKIGEFYNELPTIYLYMNKRLIIFVYKKDAWKVKYKRLKLKDCESYKHKTCGGYAKSFVTTKTVKILSTWTSDIIKITASIK